MNKNPKVFISYSHDGDEHKEWVLRLAIDLMGKGIDTVLDQWELNLGANLPKFMEHGLQESDRVLAVCTDNYNEKSNGGIGGTGYENNILTAELLLNQKTTKFIPVVRAVTKAMKTPLCLAGRMYIDFSDNAAYEQSLNQLIHEVYGVKLRAKPPLGKNPFIETEDDRPTLGENSTTFFFNRFCSAFPGVRGIAWFGGKEAVDRLMILLKIPLNFKDGAPIWWWRSGDCQIERFDRLHENIVLMDYQELRIRRIAAVNSGSYYQSFIYVEVEADKPTGLYKIDISADVKDRGYSREEYGLFEGRTISRAEYDDDATVIDGKPVDLHGKADLRVRYLTPYNFIIAAHNSPINNGGYDNRRDEVLNNVLMGKLPLEQLVDEIHKLPKRGY
ncbi:toll/interleukin-1 receptor domain-containing protein [Nitrosospira sp. NpAV]|uniref:toll/interleukin-1 receptor domain-containing protein n=1 Tax=Nitrosospira sp. NpAV TaxID=58133 RepID=UPI00059F3ED9|nr:toll/interleukin-1 receptor domain-containing protein [Nitrosospira sp. NpAV]KIO48295.1 SEFIR domain-containing protein [Nitrosospira sp. NpAV]